MNHLFTISEVSQLLNIPASTLRFWEDEGLIFVTKSDNHYRKYTLKNIVQIAEIMFYRNLGISIKQIKQFENYTLAQHYESLSFRSNQVKQLILQKEKMYEGLVYKINQLDKIKYLKDIDFKYERIPFNSVVKFEYTDKKKLLNYIDDLSCYIRYWSGPDIKNETRGICTDEVDTNDVILWKKTDDKMYAVFLIKEIVTQNYKSDIKEKLEAIKKKHKIGAVLAQYLATGMENGEPIDFLKAYAEILD